MATFESSGLDELLKAFEAIGDIPEQVTEDTLLAMAEVAKDRIKQTGEAMGVKDPESSQHIVDKQKIGKVKFQKDGGSVTLSFTGTRPNGKKRRNNSTIAYFNEFGKRGQPARPFVKTALEKYGDEITEAGAAKFFAWQEKTFQQK